MYLHYLVEMQRFGPYKEQSWILLWFSADKRLILLVLNANQQGSQVLFNVHAPGMRLMLGLLFFCLHLASGGGAVTQVPQRSPVPPPKLLRLCGGCQFSRTKTYLILEHAHSVHESKEQKLLRFFQECLF